MDLTDFPVSIAVELATDLRIIALVTFFFSTLMLNPDNLDAIGLNSIPPLQYYQ